MSFTEKPLVSKVVINSTPAKTYNPITPTRDFNLSLLDLNLTGEGKASSFTIGIEDSAASLRDWALSIEGKSVDIWIAKGVQGDADPFAAATKQFSGIIGHKALVRKNKTELHYVLTGYDWSRRAMKRVIAIRRSQKRLADGISVDTTDTSTELGALVKDIIQDTDAYPTGEPTMENDDGFTLGGVDSTGLSIPTFVVDYKHAADGLNELAETGARAWWADENKQLNYKKPSLTDSGVLIIDDPADSLATTWDQTKLGYIDMDEDLTLNDDIEEDMVNRWFGKGGDDISIDQEIDTPDPPTQKDKIDTLYRAVKFTPLHRRMSHVGIYVGKVGSPTSDLQGEIREDKANEPTGSVLKAFNIGKDKVTPGGGWIVTDIGVEHIQVNLAVWVVLFKTGDATNTFEWYHNAGAANTISTSPDYSAWTTVGSTKGYFFRQYISQPLIHVGQDPTSITNYKLSEDVYSNPDIVEKQTMISLIANLLEITAKKKRVLSFPVIPPNTLPKVGQTIRFKDSGFNIDALYEVVGVHYRFDSEKDPVGIWDYGISVAGLVA